MPEMKTDEFKFYKKIIEEDVKEHATGLEKYNVPKDVIDAYNGIFTSHPDDSMIENYLFVGAATVLPSLFYQLPRVIVRPKRDTLQFEAAVLTALINASYGHSEKVENQLCIVDAFLPYGYAVMKNGYNSRVAKTPGKASVITGGTKAKNPNDMEADNEYIQFEKAISLRESPKTTFLDSSQPFGKGNRITFEYDRTLQQLIDSNLYNLSSNFLSYYGTRDRDKRLIKLKINEHWCVKNDGVWKLSYMEGWEEPLQWVKTEYNKLPVSMLRFNKIGDILYVMSHGSLAIKAQKELNYLNELWKKHIDNIRNQHAIYEEALTENGKKTLKNNDIGGIIHTNKPLTAGIAAPLQSASVDPQLFGNIQNVREYLKLILSTTGGKLGGPESELATTEKNKALGDVLRSSGMQDSIRDFMIDQIKQRIVNYLEFGTPDMILKMTGENLHNPMTGKPIEPGTELKLGGDTGFMLQDLITGDIDSDFILDVDVQSAARPDFPVIRKQIAEGIALSSQLMPALQQSGKRVNFSLMLEDYFSTFDAIPNASKYIQDMSEEDKMKMVMQAAAGAEEETKGETKGGGIPTEESIARSTEPASATKGIGI